jgi:hypothetical protein
MIPYFSKPHDEKQMDYLYLIKNGDEPPENDMAFYSEKVAYEWWIEYYAGDITDHMDRLDESGKDHLLRVWNDTSIDLVEKVQTIDKFLDGHYLDQDVVKLIRMEITH